MERSEPGSGAAWAAAPAPFQGAGRPPWVPESPLAKRAHLWEGLSRLCFGGERLWANRRCRGPVTLRPCDGHGCRAPPGAGVEGADLRSQGVLPR